MAQMPIEILDLRRARTELLTSAIELANNVQDQYRFSALESAKSYELLFAVHDDTDIAAFIPRLLERKLGWGGFHPFIMCLFDTAINVDGTHNLFTVDTADSGFAAVTTHNVEKVLIPTQQMPAYIIFQLAFFALKFSGCNIPFHDDDRGCLFDYREEKRGIVDAIRKGHICDQCKVKLQAKNNHASPAQLTSIFAMFDAGSKLIQKSRKEPSDTRAKPNIFIGSSTEGLNVARAIQSELEHDFNVEIWNQSNVFVLGSVTLEALESAVKSYDFSIFVFTPDDEIEMRDKKSPAARDNVIFEAGLFIGKIGRQRSFIVRPRNVQMQIPSDLNGLTVADYDSTRANLTAALGTACTKIRETIKNHAATSNGLRSAT
jgi:predicted nucleotide-binding protein